MILDSQELEFLKLCALARYMPCGLAGIFEMQILKSEVSGRLAKSGYLKYVNGGCKFSRLTRRGRDILLRAGYEFPDDARPHKKGNTFNRRVINAKLNAMLYGAGINIYAGTKQGGLYLHTKPDYTLGNEKQGSCRDSILRDTPYR